MLRTVVAYASVALLVVGLFVALPGCSTARPERTWEPSVPANAREVDIARRLESGTITSVEELLIGEPSIIYEGGTVRVRGRSGSPLWVIDGTQTNSTYGLNPYEVARMWVVADAVNPRYGRRGANGVIIVQTRVQ